mgnify:CR=1 FL=1
MQQIKNKSRERIQIHVNKQNEAQDKLLPDDENLKSTQIKLKNVETSNHSYELIKFETNKVRYRNLKQFLYKFLGELFKKHCLYY